MALTAIAVPAQEPPGNPKPQIITEEIRTLIAVVNFEEGSAKPTAFSAAALDSVAAIIKKNQNRRYEVHGFHCQDAGGQGRVARSSAQRVEAMLNYLHRKTITTTSCGTVFLCVAPSDCCGE